MKNCWTNKAEQLAALQELVLDQAWKLDQLEYQIERLEKYLGKYIDYRIKGNERRKARKESE